jgi:hypothetical protein
MVYMNMNLDRVTCIQKFKVPLQVVNRTYKGKPKKSSNLNLNLI